MYLSAKPLQWRPPGRHRWIGSKAYDDAAYDRPQKGLDQFGIRAPKFRHPLMCDVSRTVPGGKTMPEIQYCAMCGGIQPAGSKMHEISINDAKVIDVCYLCAGRLKGELNVADQRMRAKVKSALTSVPQEQPTQESAPPAAEQPEQPADSPGIQTEGEQSAQ